MTSAHDTRVCQSCQTPKPLSAFKILKSKCDPCHRASEAERYRRHYHSDPAFRQSQLEKRQRQLDRIGRKGRKFLTDEQRRRRNRAKERARDRRVRAAKPTWVSTAELAKVYAMRREISERTGIEHHVDHHVPLGGKNVCGLHVPWNLVIVQAKPNLKKGNGHDEGWHCPWPRAF